MRPMQIKAKTWERGGHPPLKYPCENWGRIGRYIVVNMYPGISQADISVNPKIKLNLNSSSSKSLYPTLSHANQDHYRNTCHVGRFRPGQLARSLRRHPPLVTAVHGWTRRIHPRGHQRRHSRRPHGVCQRVRYCRSGSACRPRAEQLLRHVQHRGGSVGRPAVPPSFRPR